MAALCLLSGSTDAEASQAKTASSNKIRRMELRIGVVPFHDPRNPENSLQAEESDRTLRNYFREVKRLYAEDSIDLEIKLVQGSYYQILKWMQDDLLDGAVVSSFTAHLLTEDRSLALLPVIEFARSASGPKFSVRGKGWKTPETALWECLKAVESSLEEPVAHQPCEFRFVSHLSATGFVIPLIYIQEKYVRPGKMAVSQQQAFWTRLLQWSRLDLLHGVREPGFSAHTSIAFTYIKDARSLTLPLEDAPSLTKINDVLLLGCRRQQAGDPPVTDEDRRKLLTDCAEKSKLLGDLSRPESAAHWETAGGVVKALSKESKAYVAATKWSQPDRTRFTNRIRSVFHPLPPDQKAPALGALYQRWYGQGDYGFSIDEVIDVLKVDQVIRSAPSAALVLPGGGVRATYQSVILDHLYSNSIINAGATKSERDPQQCLPVSTFLPAEMDRLVIQGIAGTSGGALLGYFASRRDATSSHELTRLWIDELVVKTTPLKVFPKFGVLRWISLLLLVAVFAATSAVHMSHKRRPLKPEVPFWYTTFLSIVIIGAPFLIWWKARSDPAYRPSAEGWVMLIVVLFVHFIHSVTYPGPPPAKSSRWLWRGVGVSLLGLSLAALLMSQCDWIHETDSRLAAALTWNFGALVSLVALVVGLTCIAAARGLDFHSPSLFGYRDSVVLLALLHAFVGTVFFCGLLARRVTLLEMTADYWLWVFVGALFAAKLIITAERIYGNVPLRRGIHFISSPSGTVPFPYTPAVTLVAWGGLGIFVWLTFIAPALYSSQRGRDEFNTTADRWQGRELVPLIVSMTGLGDDVEGYQSPPYRGDYYAVDKRWCSIDELEENTSSRLFYLDSAHFRDAVFASGSPFPIYPATPVLAEGKMKGLFVDGGFAHRVPIEAAGLVRAAQILVVENAARRGGPASDEGFRAGALTTNAPKIFGFLFDRSQTVDDQRSRFPVVATIYPDWSPPDPFLMDFRESVVSKLQAEAERDLKGHRVARVGSWGIPGREVSIDEP
jgi:predicted acylesterase/phospholipase RssA